MPLHPLLDKLTVSLFHEHELTFETPQLASFISHSPKFKAHNEARVVSSDWHVGLILPQTSDGALKLGILCGSRDAMHSISLISR